MDAGKESSRERKTSRVLDSEMDTVVCCLQAQQHQEEMAIAGSASASPPAPFEAMVPGNGGANRGSMSGTDSWSGGGGNGDGSWDNDLDDLMMMEAIRLSLRDAAPLDTGEHLYQ